MNEFKTTAIEKISVAHEIDDLWDTMSFSSQNPYFIYAKATRLVLRFIGDFLPCERFYIPSDHILSNTLSNEDFANLVKKKRNTYDSLINTLTSLLSEDLKSAIKPNPNQRFKNKHLNNKDEKIVRAIEIVNEIYFRQKTYPCFLVNALVRESAQSQTNAKIGIFTITNTLYPKIAQALKNINSSKISGLHACDFEITYKQVEGQKYPSFDINVSSPSMIDISDMRSMFKYGIFDIEKSIRWSNRNTLERKKGFIIKPIDSYKTKDLMLDKMREEFKDIVEYERQEMIDNYVHELPEEIFEDTSANPIHGLEL